MNDLTAINGWQLCETDYKQKICHTDVWGNNATKEACFVWKLQESHLISISTFAKFIIVSSIQRVNTDFDVSCL